MVEPAHETTRTFRAPAEDEFAARVRSIDQTALKQDLRLRAEPCYESQLLRVAFPELDVAHIDPLPLFQSHFLLFHVLYRLQDEFYQDNQYLHIHFMRIRLAPYPKAGACRFFNELLGRFCAAACASDAGYCDFHRARVGDAALDELSLRFFYLDSRNFYTLDERTAAAFINGTWEILAHYDDYRRSFKALDLPQSADIAMIKKRFRELAKQYHPDTGATAPEQFYDINNAYRLLLHIHSTIQALPTNDGTP